MLQIGYGDLSALPGDGPGIPRPGAGSVSRAVGDIIRGPAGGRRILLVENDRDIAEMYRYKLDLDGYEVSVAGSGAEALERIQDWEPELVLLDVGLPDMSGLRILEELADDPREDSPPVLVLSADGEPPQVERALELGALDWLRKAETPPSTLSRWVRAWLFAVSAVRTPADEVATP